MVLIDEADGSGRCLACGSDGLCLTRPFATEFLQNRAETWVTTASMSEGALESLLLLLVLFCAATGRATSATGEVVDEGAGRTRRCSGTLTLLLLSLAFLFFVCSGRAVESSINENDLFACLLTSARS